MCALQGTQHVDLVTQVLSCWDTPRVVDQSPHQNQPRPIDLNLLKLCDPEPDALGPILGPFHRPFDRIEGSLARHQVCLFRLDPWRLLHQLPYSIETEEDGETDVRGDEGLIIPFARDRIPTVEERDQGKEQKASPREVRLERRAVV
jgi:hypothetical protein